MPVRPSRLATLPKTKPFVGAPKSSINEAWVPRWPDLEHKNCLNIIYIYMFLERERERAVSRDHLYTM